MTHGGFLFLQNTQLRQRKKARLLAEAPWWISEDVENNSKTVSSHIYPMGKTSRKLLETHHTSGKSSIKTLI